MCWSPVARMTRASMPAMAPSMSVPRPGASTMLPGRWALSRAPPCRRLQRKLYANANPFLFTGGRWSSPGPTSTTSTAAPSPHASCPIPTGFSLRRSSRGHGFRKGKRHQQHLPSGQPPLLWLPYVTHPVDTGSRQTGILIPDIGFNSASKGDTVGEQIYWAINRSTDLTLGTIYYSARGWEQTASLRYRGLGQNFARRATAVCRTAATTLAGSTPIRAVRTSSFRRATTYLDGRYSITSPRHGGSPVQARMVADLEYSAPSPIARHSPPTSTGDLQRCNLHHLRHAELGRLRCLLRRRPLPRREAGRHHRAFAG